MAALQFSCPELDLDFGFIHGRHNRFNTFSKSFIQKTSLLK